MYWLRVIYKWFSYGWALILALLLGNLILFAILSPGTESVTENIGNHGYYGKHQLYAYLMILFGPFLNLWVWLKLVSFFKEATEDAVNAPSKFPPKSQNTAILICSAFLGSFLMPLFLWLYTNRSELLWGENANFWWQPGFWLGAIASLIFVFLLPKYAPQITRPVLALVSKIEDKFVR